MPTTTTIALQLYSVREHLATENDVATTMAHIKKAGYDAAEIPGLPHIKPAKLYQIMSDVGVKPIGVHFRIEQFSCPISGDPFKSIAISRANIRAMGLG